MVTFQELGLNDTFCPDAYSLKTALADYSLITPENFDICQNYMSYHLTTTHGVIIGLAGVLLGVGLTFWILYVNKKNKKE